MGYTIKFEYPNLSPGQVVQVPGLGEFENGKSHELTDEQVQAWRASNFSLLPVMDKANQPTGEYRRKEGMRLSEYFAHSDYVTVKETKSTRESTSEEDELTQVKMVPVDESQDDEALVTEGSEVPDIGTERHGEPDLKTEEELAAEQEGSEK
jgi:hypothetical protein